jgi:hypothetical protein
MPGPDSFPQDYGRFRLTSSDINLLIFVKVFKRGGYVVPNSNLNSVVNHRLISPASPELSEIIVLLFGVKEVQSGDGRVILDERSDVAQGGVLSGPPANAALPIAASMMTQKQRAVDNKKPQFWPHFCFSI